RSPYLLFLLSPSPNLPAAVSLSRSPPIQSAAEEAIDRRSLARMIYRNWSLLSSTVVIWGSVGAAGLAGIFLFGGKEKFQGYLSREGERLRQQDRAMMGKN
uniref:Succinate dehydrogenase subunit 8A, mitochondrial n=3 Tax=Triticinae TaxID=1648030 RepID=A0A453QGS6_AEGTS